MIDSIVCLIIQGKFHQKLCYAWTPVKSFDNKTIWFDEYLEFYNRETMEFLGIFNFDHWQEIIKKVNECDSTPSGRRKILLQHKMNNSFN